MEGKERHPVDSPNEVIGGENIGSFTRAGMLLLNTVPLIQTAAVVLVAVLPYAVVWWRLVASLAVLFVIPPLLARVMLHLFPIKEGKIPLGSGSFLTWWTLLQLQVLYCRLTFLEEALRIVPGLYSMWLRLWGARIGRLTYWAPGTLILDRSFIRIGDDVILGAGVRINPHVIQKGECGALELLLGTVIIGDRSTVGGYSLITAGCEVAAGESTHAFLIMPPFTRWEGGRRSKTFREGTGFRGDDPTL